MKTVKVILGLVIGFFASITMFQMFFEESGAGLYGALTGYVVIMAICIWLVYSGSKTTKIIGDVSQEREKIINQNTPKQNALPSTSDYQKLKDLYEGGVLTKEEFEAKTQTTTPKVETNKSIPVKTVLILLVVIGIVGFGISQKDEILKIVNSAEKTNKIPTYYPINTPKSTTTYQQPTKKYIFAIFKVEVPEIDIMRTGQYSSMMCSLKYPTKTMYFTSDIQEVFDYNTDKKFILLDYTEKSVSERLLSFNINFEMDYRRCPSSDQEWLKTHRAKIIERDVFDFDTYTMASISKSNFN